MFFFFHLTKNCRDLSLTIFNLKLPQHKVRANSGSAGLSLVHSPSLTLFYQQRAPKEYLVIKAFFIFFCSSAKSKCFPPSRCRQWIIFTSFPVLWAWIVFYMYLSEFAVISVSSWWYLGLRKTYCLFSSRFALRGYCWYVCRLEYLLSNVT